ncbi:hypothetical protein NQ314_009362 [Rhamnusium bicolor]|uniref:39S ribosomal protein L23, mitochondrial n=1 Tax=Rhamnusium bicolor TaxID=1586634 RepID=A0AAV8Y2T8_9CUCU|nr:hypothetical protein NQ314_009362 [Rhamnusium bicolor]
MPRTRKDPGKGYVIKDDDVKYAYITLPKNESFVFPDLFEKDEQEEDQDHRKALKEAKKGFENYIQKNKHRPNMPGWFTV